jgi:hypothetical protein
MGKKRQPEIILKTDESDIHLELGRGGKFAAKSSGWDENRVFLEGDKLEVAVRNGPRLSKKSEVVLVVTVEIGNQK